MSLDDLPLFQNSSPTLTVSKKQVSKSQGSSKKAHKKTRKKASQKGSPEIAPVSSPVVSPLVSKEPLTVSMLNAQIKGIIEPHFESVWVKGEVSNFRPAASGHVYFSLKDSESSLSAVVFGWRKRKTFEFKDGMEVLCRGKVSVYSPRGSYQIVVDTIEPLGAGALQVAFEQLKNQLQTEGLFDRDKKRSIPSFPSRLAIITSPSGAAIRDILNILKRRAPHVEVLVVPALVQGEKAASTLIRAVEMVNEYRLGDVLLLTRGGGSIEDLWCFNHEGLARAISASHIPVISAVGHEIDFTISDFVSDLRAPTPSAAAELVTTQWVESIGILRDQAARLEFCMKKFFEEKAQVLHHLSRRLKSPADQIREQEQRCDDWLLRFERAMKNGIDLRRHQLEQFLGKLNALSPLKVLERGYAIVHDAENDRIVIKSADQIQKMGKGQNYKIRFTDGEAWVQSV